jgi:hypothetical protein
MIYLNKSLSKERFQDVNLTFSRTFVLTLIILFFLQLDLMTRKFPPKIPQAPVPALTGINAQGNFFVVVVKS